MHDGRVVQILLVEDNQEDAEVAVRALSRNNFSYGIVHAGDGREALDFIFGR